MVIDSALKIATTDPDAEVRVDVASAMNLIDPEFALFPLTAWVAIIQQEPDDEVRFFYAFTLYREHPDTAAVIEAAVQIAQTHGNSFLDVDLAVDVLHALGAREALQQLWDSGLVTNESARRRLSFYVPHVPPALPAWATGTAYAVGDEVSHQGMDFRCRQAHTAQSGWEPPAVYALWERINAGENWTPQVIYAVGAEVLYQGVRYRAIQGHQAQPDLQPPITPSLWQRVN